MLGRATVGMLPMFFVVVGWLIHPLHCMAPTTIHGRMRVSLQSLIEKTYAPNMCPSVVFFLRFDDLLCLQPVCHQILL